ncbi:MAG: hypothetical protein HUK20_11940 [Fibrobacter sp.]|nr:hypothetical protein [Fibrobacter sp.]
MNKVTSILIYLLAVAFVAQAAEVRNVCDTLSKSENPYLNLQLAYVDQIEWTSDKGPNDDSAKTTTRLGDVTKITVKRNYFTYEMPVSIKAACKVTSGLDYQYATWDTTKSAFSVLTADKKYSSKIMRSSEVALSGIDTNKVFNLLAFREGDWDDQTSFTAGSQMIASSSLEPQFDWWYTAIRYVKVTYDTVITTTPHKDDSSKVDTTTSIKKKTSSKTKSVVAMDSVSAFNGAKMEDSLLGEYTEFEVGIYHAVLMDSAKIVPADDPTDPDDPDDPENPEEPSFVKDINALPTQTTRVDVRRLDGTKVLGSWSNLKPGVYYVKRSNGMWIKEIKR